MRHFEEIKKIRFATRLTVYFTLFIILLGGGVGFYVYSYVAKVFIEVTEDRFLNQAFHTMVKIKMFMANTYEDVENLSDTLSMVAERENTTKIQERIASFKKSHDVAAISYFDMHLNKIAGNSDIKTSTNAENEAAAKYLGNKESGDFDFYIVRDKSVLNGAHFIYFIQLVKDHSGKKQGVIIASVLTDGLDEILGQVEGKYKGNKDITMDILNNDGLVIYSNYDKDRISKEVSLDWKDISHTRKNGETTGIHRHIHKGIGDELHAFAITSDGKLFQKHNWIVLLHFPVRVIFVAITQLKEQLIYFAIGVLLLGMIIIRYLSLKLTGPIQKIVVGGDSIASGNFDVYLNVDEPIREIELLATTFNRISEHLRKFKQEVLNKAAELEAKVESRTLELNTVNAKLEDELEERKSLTKTLVEKKRELEEYNKEINVLSELTEWLQGCHTSKEAYSMIAQFGNELFPRNPGGILLYDTEAEVFKPVAGWGVHPFGGQELRNGECITLNCGKPYISNNETHRYGSHCSFSQKLTVPHMCVPIADMGLLQIIVDEKADIEEHKTIKSLAITISKRLKVALTNLRLREELKRLSIKDPLTGLFNRGYMKEALERELIYAAREKLQVGVIMLDIDHFKQINDTYGHPCGDIVLREIGKIILNDQRGSDISCRYGGEEFLMILPKINLIHLIGKAEQLANKIRNMEVINESVLHKDITVSMGVALYPTHGLDMTTLINAADAALYEAKSAGRDRVCFPNPSGLQIVGGSNV